MVTGRGVEAVTKRILRLTYIAQEPLKVLLTISGYVKMSLIPLEEAVEQLDEFLYIVLKATLRSADR
jgi:hypothetical protein